MASSGKGKGKIKIKKSDSTASRSAPASRRPEDVWSSKSIFEGGSKEWAWDDTTPIDVELIIPDMAPYRSRNPPKFVTYDVVVTRGFGPEKESWTIQTRYSEIATLQASVLAETGMAYDMPKKRMFGNLNPDFILARRQQLEALLQKIVRHPALRHSVAVKEFFDSRRHAKRLSLHAHSEVSMHLRGNAQFALEGPLPNIGWRFSKAHFAVKTPSGTKKILTWTPYLRRSHIDRDDTRRVLDWLMKIDHPNIFPGEHLELLDSERGAVISIRDILPRGSLKDLIYGVEVPLSPYAKKYTRKGISPTAGLDLPSIRLYGCHILQGLQFLHQKFFPYGHLHSGNVMIGADGVAKLCDLECALLGYADVYSEYITELKKIQTFEECDVYCFGHVLYEMSKGAQLLLPTCSESLHGVAGAEVLELILHSNATKTKLPKVSALLDHSFFQGAPSGGREATIKITSRIKDIFCGVAQQRTEAFHNDQLRLRDFRKAEARETDKRKKQAHKSRVATGIV